MQAQALKEKEEEPLQYDWVTTLDGRCMTQRAYWAERLCTGTLGADRRGTVVAAFHDGFVLLWADNARQERYELHHIRGAAAISFAEFRELVRLKNGGRPFLPTASEVDV
jgi:hypothetical protein